MSDGSAYNPAYLAHCPDCIPLPEQFPASCAAVLVNALRGQVDDIACVVHCGLTLAAWALGRFHDHPAAEVGSAFIGRDAAAAYLESVQASGGNYSSAAFPWRQVVAVVLDLIRELLLRQP